MLDKIKGALEKLKGLNFGDGAVEESISNLVNSRLLGLAVGLTGTKADDAVLAALKAAFPKK